MTLDKPGYARFGLTANPFQGLASESLEDIELYHVGLDIDDTLRTMKQEVLDGSRKAVVALVGPLGAGKTQRLMMAAREAQSAEALSVYVQLTTESAWGVRALSEALRAAVPLSGFVKRFSTPKWYRDLQQMEKGAQGDYDPEDAARVVAEALNQNAPVFVMLNDVHNLAETSETDRFMHTLQALTNLVRPGVMVLFTCYEDWYRRLEERHPALTTRIDRVLPVRTLRDEEAALLIAKRLPAHRVVEDLDPLYPFKPDAVARMNEVCNGNPRRLLKVADLVMEAAVRGRAYHIDAELVDTVDASLALGHAPHEPGPVHTARPDPRHAGTNGKHPAGAGGGGEGVVVEKLAGAQGEPEADVPEVRGDERDVASPAHPEPAKTAGSEGAESSGPPAGGRPGHKSGVKRRSGRKRR